MSGTAGMRDFSRERELALAHAVALHHQRYAEAGGGTHADDEVIGTATAAFRFLVGPAFLILRFGPVTEQDTGEVVPTNGGSTSMGQIRATQQFTASVDVVDARGNLIPNAPGVEDDLTWSVSGDDVLDVETAEDTRSATFKASGPVGSAIIRVETGDLFVTEAVDVVPGVAALMRITVGEATEQPEVEQPEDPEVPPQA